jgi:outer membrane biosynthesis protein TonB
LRTLIERGEGTSASATMLRLLWLRQDHHAATIVTETAHLTETAVVIRATISIPGGGGGSGLAAATVDDPSEWAEAVERAETNAISRALDTLGYVLERASSVSAPAQRQSSPQPQAQPPQQIPQAQSGPRSMPPSQPRPTPTPIQRQDESASAPPVVNALRRAQTSRPQGAPPAPPAQPAPTQDDDAHLPEYSWTNFWNAARGYGLDAKKVEDILGRPANQSSPKEAVEALQAAGAWGSPPEDA